MKILAFAGSTSSTSINKQLVEYTSTLFSEHEYEVADLNDYEVPIYSSDYEKSNGIPKQITQFASKIDAADLLIISLAEHNGAYSAAFKNHFDWLSRIEGRKAWADKNIFLMATSPGARGGKGVLEIAADRFPRNGGNVVGTFSFPSFYDNFKEGAIVNEELLNELQARLATL